MSFVPVKTPLIVKKLYSNFTWDIQNKERTIYLTFDDGPTPEITQWTLKTLKEFNAKATFFCIGKNIQNHPDIFKNILDAGHNIGNHTQNHIKGWKTKTEDYLSNIKEAQLEIDSRIENSAFSDREPLFANLFRPPYGQITPKQGKTLIELNYRIIMWDILSFDWDQKTSKEDCYKNVISKAKSGSIIVFHDSKKASKNMMYALPKVLEFYHQKGFSFNSIPNIKKD